MYLAAKFCLLAICLVLVSATRNPEDSKLPPIREKQGEPTKQKGTGPDPQTNTTAASSVPAIIINNYITGEQKNPPPKEPEQWPPLWSIWATLAITGIASVSAVWTIGHIRSQAEAATDQAKTAKDAAVAAKDAADAAKQQGIIMRALDRPWLIPHKPKISGWPLIQSPYEIHFRWSVRNFGTSPAFLTRLSVSFGTERLPLPEPPTYNKVEPFGDMAIPQNRDHATERKITISDNLARNIIAGNGCIIVYGFLDYHDALNEEHTTHFCCYWSYKDGKPYFSPVGPLSYMKYT